jgi:hypothetical protein
MTRPDHTMSPMLDGRASRWLIALTPAALGGVILAAEASDGELAIAVGGAVYAVALLALRRYS